MSVLMWIQTSVPERIFESADDNKSMKNNKQHGKFELITILMQLV